MQTRPHLVLHWYCGLAISAVRNLLVSWLAVKRILPISFPLDVNILLFPTNLFSNYGGLGLCEKKSKNLIIGGKNIKVQPLLTECPSLSTFTFLYVFFFISFVRANTDFHQFQITCNLTFMKRPCLVNRSKSWCFSRFLDWVFFFFFFC